MKTIIQKSVAVLMVVLVLFSTLSLTINMHFCGDNLIDFALFQSADTCEMDTTNTQNDCDGNQMANSCCSDEIIHLEGQDAIKSSFDKSINQQEDVVVFFFLTYFNIFEVKVEKTIPYLNYKPPLLTGDKQALHQTFLI